MKKKIYTEAELEVVILENQDIVTASSQDKPDENDTDWGGGQPIRW